MGSVLEEQVVANLVVGENQTVDVPHIDHESAFEAGLMLLLDGLAHRVKRP